jgi:hypothetical protein
MLRDLAPDHRSKVIGMLITLGAIILFAAIPLHAAQTPREFMLAADPTGGTQIEVQLPRVPPRRILRPHPTAAPEAPGEVSETAAASVDYYGAEISVAEYASMLVKGSSSRHLFAQANATAAIELPDSPQGSIYPSCQDVCRIFMEGMYGFKIPNDKVQVWVNDEQVGNIPAAPPESLPNTAGIVLQNQFGEPYSFRASFAIPKIGTYNVKLRFEVQPGIFFVLKNTLSIKPLTQLMSVCPNGGDTIQIMFGIQTFGAAAPADMNVVLSKGGSTAAADVLLLGTAKRLYVSPGFATYVVNISQATYVAAKNFLAQNGYENGGPGVILLPSRDSFQPQGQTLDSYSLNENCGKG